jgi:hypothetical protein
MLMLMQVTSPSGVFVVSSWYLEVGSATLTFRRKPSLAARTSARWSARKLLFTFPPKSGFVGLSAERGP